MGATRAHIAHFEIVGLWRSDFRPLKATPARRQGPTRRVPQRGRCADLQSQPVAPETTLYADEAASWNALHPRYQMHRINHHEVYSLRDEAQPHTNNAEGFFSRMGGVR
jgi:hypothetical protein